MRCQVYIPKELEEVLLNDAKKAGVNVSEIIIRILKKNYKTKNSETLDYIALKDIVFKEIEEYISTLNINDEFELYDASETFRNIPMTKEGKPNVNRAKLGRLFGQSIGKKPFENVERVYILQTVMLRNQDTIKLQCLNEQNSCNTKYCNVLQREP